MKRMTYFVMALALVLGFTQCKKEQVNTPENETKTVNITLNVGGNGGSRHTINTENGDVDFQDGDVIYVGNGSTYIGTLTYDGTIFSGSIDQPDNNTEIYFFFVGGLTTTPADLSGQSSFTVDISDQSTEMPVLSCNHVTYSSSTTSYSCVLQNQCALVEFTTVSTTDPVRVGGLYTEAQIDFAAHSITHTATTGFVKLYPDADDNTAKWAVLLPQDDFSNIEGVVADKGYTISMQPETTISADGFITGEQAIGITSTPSHNRYLQWAVRDLTLEGGDHVYGTLSGNYKISIAADATVTLNNATITGTNSNSYKWAGINCENNATIILEGTNNVTSFHEDYPGIHIASDKTLTIQGSGTLNASSNGYGAGIGSSYNVDCGNIVINSGTINATGGIMMAGIGGGFRKNCGSITINGGNVTATGGRGAAGIGTGMSQVMSITINGGNVTATGGSGAAGIGTGRSQESITCGDISITAGIVNATGGRGAAGIGSGFVTYNGIHNTCGNISITGGQVTATGGDGGDHVYPDIIDNTSWENFTYYGGAGIGTGSTVNRYGSNAGSSSCGYIRITGGQVTATKGGGTYPATNSIGKNESSYNLGTCGTITIGGVDYPNGISDSPFTYEP